MTVTFHRATADDVDAVLALIAKYYAFDGIRFDEPRVSRGLLDLIENPTFGGAWLIRESKSIAGYFVLTYGFDLEFGGRQATLTDLYLEPPFRRSGVGTTTLRFVEATLQELGIGALELQVERSNAASLALYEKHGFQAHDRIPMSKEVPAGEEPLGGHLGG